MENSKLFKRRRKKQCKIAFVLPLFPHFPFNVKERVRKKYYFQVQYSKSRKNNRGYRNSRQLGIGKKCSIKFFRSCVLDSNNNNQQQKKPTNFHTFELEFLYIRCNKQFSIEEFYLKSFVVVVGSINIMFSLSLTSIIHEYIPLQ